MLYPPVPCRTLFQGIILNEQGICSMASLVAETAQVDRRAQMASDVIVGPGCVIGPEVTIGRGTRLSSHVCLMGTITIGEFNTIGPFVAIGDKPQDVSYKGAATRVEIGDCNTIRHRVTIHRASEKEDGITRVGSHNHLMAGSHVAHDCKLGDRITIGTGTLLSGHVHIEDWAYLSEGVAALQFVTVGTSSHVGGQTRASQDVPPFMLVEGNPPSVVGLNLRTSGKYTLDAEAMDALRETHRLIYQDKMPLGRVAETLESRDQLTPEVLSLIKFVECQREGKRGRARDHH